MTKQRDLYHKFTIWGSYWEEVKCKELGLFGESRGLGACPWDCIFTSSLLFSHSNLKKLLHKIFLPPVIFMLSHMRLPDYGLTLWNICQHKSIFSLVFWQWHNSKSTSSRWLLLHQLENKHTEKWFTTKSKFVAKYYRLLGNRKAHPWDGKSLNSNKVWTSIGICYLVTSSLSLPIGLKISMPLFYTKS